MSYLFFEDPFELWDANHLLDFGHNTEMLYLAWWYPYGQLDTIERPELKNMEVLDM